jgi:glycosyltransferase involved in cell wall biosynthesis
MKILLLTDIPPCKESSGALVTLHLCRFLPKDSIVCYNITDPSLDGMKIAPELQMPSRRIHKPREYGFHHVQKRLGDVRSFLNETRIVFFTLPRILNDIEQFAKLHEVDRLWCILQGQTMIRLALPAARRLGVPLLTQVWDHPSWWLESHQIDPWTSKSILKQYDDVLRNSTRIGTPSFGMAEEYREKYDVPTVRLVASLDRKSITLPSANPPLFHPDHRTLTIGLAGQVYAKEAWNALIASLDSLGWTLAGRKIRIRFVGMEAEVQANSLGPDKLELLGYRTQDETIRLLSECDILYCPYFFDERRMEISRTSYPSKVTTYLASGKPLIFHGPDYAETAALLKNHQAGEVCHSLETTAIANVLSRLASNEEHYRAIAQNGHALLMKHLTFDVLKPNFMDFVGFKENLAEVKSAVNFGSQKQPVRRKQLEACVR